MKKVLVIHPFFVAAFPILFLFDHNRAAFSGYAELVVPLAVSLGATAILLLLLSITLKDSRKAGFITSLFVMLFFTYGHVYEFAYTNAIDAFLLARHRYLLATFVLLFIAASYAIIRMRVNTTALTRILNVSAVVLVLIPLVQSGVYGRVPFASFTDNATNDDSTTPAVTATPASSPDIYYIILDSYTNSKVLESVYGYDNTPFTDYLTEKGFYIAENSISNYDGTNLSLPSSLNMSYLHEVFIDRDEVSFEEIISATRNNEVLRFLKSRGYTIIHFGHYHIPTQYNEYADRNIEVGRYGSAFTQLLVRTTALAPFVQGYFETGLRHDILEIFDVLAALAHQRKSPTFVFAHILAPHPPFVFGPDGEEVTYEEAELRGGTVVGKAYVDQLAFVNKKVKELVNTLIEESEEPPVIVIQADHGPGFPNRMTFGIFSAYYLPGRSHSALYPSITPVNSFRTVFNTYFDTEYELLPDRAYKVEGNETEGYDMTTLVDVTNEMKY